MRSLITTLYSERYPYIHNVEFETDGKLQLEQLLPQVHEKVVVDSMFVCDHPSGHPIDEQALMEDVAFKRLLRTNIFIRGWMIGQYKSVEKRIVALQAMIGRELARRE